ncbi:MAG: peptidase M4 family protein [Legionella sp.]|nr:peptidase M4 family protein [Legionella sp.]
MHPTVYFSPLVVCLALTMASPAKAAEPMPLQKESFKALQNQFHLQLPGGKKAGVAAVNNLQFLQQRTDNNQVNHVRMQQAYAGFPVIGGYAILHTKSPANALFANNAQVSMNGTVYKELEKDLGKVPAGFLKNAALAMTAFKNGLKEGIISQEQVIPVIYIDDDNQAHWAYKISALVETTGKIPARPSAIVDSQSYAPFVQWNDMKTVKEPVKGMGAGGNHKVGEFVYGKNYPTLELSRDAKKNKCYMENKDVKVVDMEHKTTQGKTMKFSCKAVNEKEDGIFWTGYKGDGYDKINGAFSPSNDALYAGYVIKHMYHDWYGLEALESNGSPMQLIMRVHYGDGYENAYWDGEQMTFGDGEGFLYPLVSLGIGSHEISHGFTQQHSNLIYYGQSGGLNESFSDMAAQAAEFYSVGTNDWRIGAEVTKEDSGYEALRYMDKPSRDGRSIDRADQYYPGIDVHFSSGVFNRLFYLMATQKGWDTRKAFDVMVKANADYWTPYSKFKDAGCGVLAAAKDLNYSLKDIEASLDDVAVQYKDCKVSVH